MTETNKALIHIKDNMRSQWSQYVRTHARGKCSILRIAVRVKKKTGTKWDRDQPGFIRRARRNRANKKGAEKSLGARGANPFSRAETHQRASTVVSRYSQTCIMYPRGDKAVRPLSSHGGIELAHRVRGAATSLALPSLTGMGEAP